MQANAWQTCASTGASALGRSVAAACLILRVAPTGARSRVECQAVCTAGHAASCCLLEAAGPSDSIKWLAVRAVHGMFVSLST
jgi:hypothetical protein